MLGRSEQVSVAEYVSSGKSGRRSSRRWAEASMKGLVGGIWILFKV